MSDVKECDPCWEDSITSWLGWCWLLLEEVFCWEVKMERWLGWDISSGNWMLGVSTGKDVLQQFVAEGSKYSGKEKLSEISCCSKGTISSLKVVVCLSVLLELLGGWSNALLSSRFGGGTRARAGWDWSVCWIEVGELRWIWVVLSASGSYFEIASACWELFLCFLIGSISVFGWIFRFLFPCVFDSSCFLSSTSCSSSASSSSSSSPSRSSSSSLVFSFSKTFSDFLAWKKLE